jgi:hypothetical protein
MRETRGGQGRDKSRTRGHEEDIRGKRGDKEGHEGDVRGT